VVGSIDGAPVRAPISGTLRGLTRDGVVVAEGDNVVEVDPRRAPEVFGLGARPRAVARGVCTAIGL
jgi:xanthine dehydrogenase accessory factor